MNAMMIRKRSLRFAADNRGASIVEFAFTLPIFFLVLAGAVDISRALYSALTVRYAVTSAARWGITGQSASGESSLTSRTDDSQTCDSSCQRAYAIESRIATTVSGLGLDPQKLTVRICPESSDCTKRNNAGTANQFVLMQASYPVDLFFSGMLQRQSPFKVSSIVFVKNEPF